MTTTTDNEQLITLEEISEVLPLTQGDGSIYRKDETGHVNHEKISTGAEKARVSFKMTMPNHWFSCDIGILFLCINNVWIIFEW